MTRLILALLLAALVPHAARAVVVDLSEFPDTGTPVPNDTVLGDQWQSIGILFSARTDGGDPIECIATDFGTSDTHLFFTPDLLGAVAVFDFVLPGTSTPTDAQYFQLVPFFNAGESAQLVGLDEFGAVVTQTEVIDAPDGDGFMAISGNFRTVEWRTQGNPGIAARSIEFEASSHCPDSPAAGCTPAAKASLSVSEKKAGNEKLTATLKAFEAATTRQDFGDPVGGVTRYDVCIYGASDQLVTELSVGRAGGVCGRKEKACWKAKKDSGWAYKDPDAIVYGARSIVAAGGSAGKGKFGVRAGNKAKKGQTSMPTGITEALQGATSARMQLLVSDAGCFEAVLGTVKKADGLQFKATSP